MSVTGPYVSNYAATADSSAVRVFARGGVSGISSSELLPALSLDFTAGPTDMAQYQPVLTFSRPSNATMFDSQGRMVWAPANMVRNSGMAGAVIGSPGTLPTWWATSVAGAHRPQVVGLGVENGIDYIDIRVAGTPTNSNDEALLFFEDPSTIGVVAFIGQRMTGSAYYRLLSGSFAGLRYLEHQVAEYNGLIWLDNTNSRVNLVPVVSGASLSSQRVTTTRTLNQPTANAVTIVLGVGFAVGVPVNFTLRVGLPQLERTGPDSPKAPIRTTGAAFYGPRFDTNPLTLQPRGLLMESFASNIIIHNSEVLRPSAGWSELNMATAPSALPDLFQNGVFTTLTSTNAPTGCRLSSDNLRASVGAGWTTGQLLTATVYMRRGTADGYICFDDGGGSVYACCRVNLTGAGTVAVTGSGAGLIGTVERINNDTYRVRITYTYDTAQSAVRVSVGVWNSTNYTFNYPECTTNGQTVHAWGVQLETTGFPTSYIPRLGASTSRSRDFCATTNTLFAGTGTVGTWAAEGESPGPAQTNYYPCMVDFRNTNTNWRTVGLRIEATNGLGAEVVNAVAGGQYPVAAAGLLRYAAAADGVSAFSVSVNGTTVVDSTGARFNTMPTGMNQVTIANQTNDLDQLSWNGWVRRVRWWNSRLTDATLTQLTAL